MSADNGGSDDTWRVLNCSKEKNYTGNRVALFAGVDEYARDIYIKIVGRYSVASGTRSAGSVDMIVTRLYVRESRNRTG